MLHSFTDAGALQMVSIYRNVFTTDVTKSKVSIVKWKISTGIGMANTYLITLASNNNDVFDIYSGTVFKQKRIRKMNFVVIGIAESDSAAKELVIKMLDYYDKNKKNDQSARDFFAELVNSDM